MHILYNRFNTSRKSSYRLLTQVVKEGSVLEVRKTACTSGAVAHCMHMLTTYEQLSTVSKDLKLVPPKKIDERTIAFPYVEDQRLFNQVVTEAFQRSDQEFVTCVQKFRELLVSLHTENPAYRFAFHEKFGPDFKEDKFMYPGCLDVNFGNLFVQEGSSTWTLIDYEWMFPCAFPQSYILIRSLLEWYYGLVKNPSNRSLQDILSLLNITPEQQDATFRVEYQLQKLVNDTVPSLEDYLAGKDAYLEQRSTQALVYPKLKEEQYRQQLDTLTERHHELSRFITEYVWNTNEFPTYDIIIPVYNGAHFVKDCVSSVLANTNYPSFRVLIVDDASTDPETISYLDQIAAQDDRIVLLRQEVNGGFVRSVNVGMLASDHNVILLNSDTIVTENWLLQMHKCRTQCTAVGSITPLTNNGTICSVPHWMQDNELPQGHTVESFAQLISTTSLHRYPTLPTAVGFCMLMPREAITLVGIFDEDIYGKGYGEENDWCVRAAQKGFQHYLDDGTFILHRGSMTFNQEPNKKALQEANARKLHEQHPHYGRQVEQFIASNPLREIIDNIALQLQFTNGKKNLLLVLHEEFRTPVGGTEYHVRDLANYFRQEYNIFVVFPRIHAGYIALVLWSSNGTDTEFHFPIEKHVNDSLFHQESMLTTLRRIIIGAHISLVHVHHMLHWPLSICSLFQELGVPYVFSAHDFSFYCQCPPLLYQNKEYCAFSKTPATCESCMTVNPYFREGHWNYKVLVERRDFFKRALAQAERVVTPSSFVQRALHKELDLPSELLEVIPHAVDHYCTPQDIETTTTNALRVAFLGSFTHLKGSKLFTELVLTTDHPHVQFYTIGAVGDTEAFNRIKNKVTHLGRYERSDVCRLLQEHQIDVVLLPSIVPETFAYALSEALESGCKVITTAMGAQQDRLLETPEAGWCLQFKTFASEARTLLHELWDQKQAGADLRYHGAPLATQAEMMRAHEVLYRSLFPQKQLPRTAEPGAFLLRYMLPEPQQLPQALHHNLNWKDYVYLFLVKVRLIGVARPIYYYLRGLRKK